MQRLILALLAIAAIGVMVGHSLRGAWAIGLLLGVMILATACEWRKLRREADTPDALDRLGIGVVFIANALADWDEVEAWIVHMLG